MAGGRIREDVLAAVAAARRDGRTNAPRSAERVYRSTAVWLVSCIHTLYRCEVEGPYHIKPGFCPACGRKATATRKE